MTIPEIVALFPSKVPANPSMGVQVLPDKSNVPFVASVTVFPEKKSRSCPFSPFTITASPARSAALERVKLVSFVLYQETS